MSADIRIIALFGARSYFGQERANIETLAALQEQGCAVLCAIRNEEWPELVELRRRLSERGLAWKLFHYTDIPRRGWIIRTIVRSPFAYMRANMELSSAIGEFKATHIHVFNQYYWFNFLIAIIFSGLPAIYRAGDKPTLHNCFWRALWKSIVWRANYFVADSHYVKEQLVSAGVDASRVSVIYAPPPRRVGMLPVQLPMKQGKGPSFRFVYVGRITEDKGVSVLVKAFSLILERSLSAQLIIAGPITDWTGDAWARALRDTVLQDARLRENVHFLGSVENVPNLMQQCDVHVCPSIGAEAYGLVVVEAKSASRPSVVFATGGLMELVETEVDGLCLTSKTAAALATALSYYVNAPDRAKEHGANAFASLGKLGVQNFAQEWLTIYQANPLV
jgi:glycosyltransferase involved in cell wall biosynthesis